jgi:hypothetical protein
MYVMSHVSKEYTRQLEVKEWTRSPGVQIPPFGFSGSFRHHLHIQEQTKKKKRQIFKNHKTQKWKKWRNTPQNDWIEISKWSGKECIFTHTQDLPHTAHIHCMLHNQRELIHFSKEEKERKENDSSIDWKEKMNNKMWKEIHYWECYIWLEERRGFYIYIKGKRNSKRWVDRSFWTDWISFLVLFSIIFCKKLWNSIKELQQIENKVCVCVCVFSMCMWSRR